MGPWFPSCLLRFRSKFFTQVWLVDLLACAGYLVVLFVEVCASWARYFLLFSVYGRAFLFAVSYGAFLVHLFSICSLFFASSCSSFVVFELLCFSNFGNSFSLPSITRLCLPVSATHHLYTQSPKAIRKSKVQKMKNKERELAHLRLYPLHNPINQFFWIRQQLRRTSLSHPCSRQSL